MRHSFQGWLVGCSMIAAMLVGAGGVTLAGRAAEAKPKAAARAASSGGPAKEVNACGCYKDTAGACFCGKKGKCACPNDCEPKGCEEKRQKEMTKEIAAETKKAAAADKKQRQSSRGGGAKSVKHKTDGTGQ